MNTPNKLTLIRVLMILFLCCCCTFASLIISIYACRLYFRSITMRLTEDLARSGDR